MAAKKFLRLVAGICTEVLGIVTSAGAANDGDIPVLDATGRLDASLMPVGVAADTYTANTSEAVAAGAFVYITATGLIANASAASGGNQARGFVLAASASGAPATVYFEGRNTQLTGLTVGGRYYLSDSVAGAVTVTAVTGAGKKLQLLGYAVSATSLDSEIDDYIALLA
jgi:hypothetical protein